jgi:hypothetical protein
VTIARIYRDKGGQWQQTTSFGVDDLPVLQKVIDQAFEAVLHLQGSVTTPDSDSGDGEGDDAHAEPASTGSSEASGNSREAKAAGASGGGGKARKRG